MPPGFGHSVMLSSARSTIWHHFWFAFIGAGRASWLAASWGKKCSTFQVACCNLKRLLSGTAFEKDTAKQNAKHKCAWPTCGPPSALILACTTFGGPILGVGLWGLRLDPGPGCSVGQTGRQPRQQHGTKKAAQLSIRLLGPCRPKCGDQWACQQ